MASFCWERRPDGPFATLIAVATTYLDLENYDLDSLKELARRQDDEEMRVFKSELREALRNPSQVPGDELAQAVGYDDGSGEAFLRRLWHDLYGDEPLEAPRGLFDPDLEFRQLDTNELLAMVSRTSESVLRRGRAMMGAGPAFAHYDSADPAWPDLSARKPGYVFLHRPPRSALHRTVPGWYVAGGGYQIHVGRSSADIAHVMTVEVAGSDKPLDPG